ncbi:MAG TPA: SGNH/GDSL hydrolase family protein [Anaeromyxobacter sp.]
MNVTYRRGVRSFLGAVLALAVGGAGQARAGSTAGVRVDVKPAYLALGDSVPYGLDPHLTPVLPFSCFSCGSFTSPTPPPTDHVFVGYPEFLSDRIGLPLTNASCPGETSASFSAPVGAGQAAICAAFKAQDWLHVRSQETQRQFALDFLQTHPHVELVTFAVGANDVFDLLAACGMDPTCVNAGIGGVLASVHANVRDVLSALRGAGYAGPVVVPGYYAPSPAWDALVSAANAQLWAAASPFDTVPVDLRALFGADPCGAGLLIPLDALEPAAGCDVHPSEAGARLIASAIADALRR